MLTDKKSESRRMVVEEVEIPSKTEENPVLEVINENEKISSEVLTKNEDIQIEESQPKENVSVQEEPKKEIPVKPIQETKQKSPVFWILIPGFLILGGILGGIVFYQKNATLTPKPSATPQASITVSATPSPSASPSAKISEFDIAIYNGSGIAGEAGKVKTLLEDSGFSVVSTGNAATYDYTKTIIKAKADIDASVIKKLRDTLSENYVVGEDQTLSSTSTTDIQVVVGSSKAE